MATAVGHRIGRDEIIWSFGPELEPVLQLCSEEAARLLVDQWSFSMEDAFIFLSVACDAGVAQACRPAPGFGTIACFSIPKLAATPGPFRP